MKFIFKEQEEKEKNFFKSSAYSECVVEYKKRNGDVEKILMVKDDNFETVIVFWNSTVHTYSTLDDSSMQGAYEQIRSDYNIDTVINIYPVSAIVTFESYEK